MHKIKKIAATAAIFASSLVSPYAVFAQAGQSGELVPTQLKTVGDLGIIPIIRAVIQFILVVAFVLAFIMLLIGGIRWITAGGDEKAVGGARNMITAALIGLVVVLVAFALIKLVETFFGVDVISGGVKIPTVADPN